MAPKFRIVCWLGPNSNKKSNQWLLKMHAKFYKNYSSLWEFHHDTASIWLISKLLKMSTYLPTIHLLYAWRIFNDTTCSIPFLSIYQKLHKVLKLKMSNAFRQESYVFDLNWIFKSQKKIFEKIKVSILEWSFFFIKLC